MKNILFHPRTPLVVGTLAVLAIAGYLALRQPMPGPLAAPHAQVKQLARLSGCAQCHHEEGFDAGCLSCHAEIREQLSTGAGFHPYLLKQEGLPGCQTCHSEHFGADFELVNRQSWGIIGTNGFNHPHVAAFDLHGRHDPLACIKCHRTEYSGPVTLPKFEKFPREKTFLGLSQDCVQCHKDVHSGGLSQKCQECHSQDTFRPAVNFDHSKHFKLEGPHERVACNGCHVIPEAPAVLPEQEALRKLAFGKVKGKTCAECHATPHRAPFGNQCLDCHNETSKHWNEQTAPLSPEKHALTGFPLIAPHQKVDCAKCHEAGLPFAEKYPDPASPGYLRQPESCQGCHKDIHEGQFAGRYIGCQDCHTPLEFKPHRFSLVQHAKKYPLQGAHGAVPCQACHRKPADSDVTQFAGTTTACKQCHTDPHGSQFVAELAQNDCTVCHTAGTATFAIRPYDHARLAKYPLSGGHARAECQQCHRPADDGVVRYRGISTDCASCHQDVHRGQFMAGNGTTQCQSCHTSTDSWRAMGFDHNSQSGFALDGVHAKVACAKCHPTVAVAENKTVVQYKPLGKQCKDCHGLKYP